MNNTIWLITARHNIYPPHPPPPQQIQQVSPPPSESYEERLPYEFRIYLKSNSSPKWEEIILSEDDLLKNGRIHNDDDVDIAAIEITDILKDKLKERTNNHYIDYYVFHKNQFPTSIKAEDSRIIIVGFPESGNSFLNPLASKPEIRSDHIRNH
jgi:SpoVK/Ycf46/Vps4 family AAA+-type ATPase